MNTRIIRVIVYCLILVLLLGIPAALIGNSQAFGQLIPFAVCEPVLLSGDHAPGFAKGVTFNPVGIPGGVFVGAPVIGEDGTIGFGGLTATVFPFDQAIWTHDQRGFQLLATTGDSAPGTSSTYSSFPSIYFVDAPRPGLGGVTSQGSLADPFNEAFSGTWIREPGGNTRLVVLSGEPAPGIPGGGTLRYVGAIQAGFGALVISGDYTPPSGSTSREHEAFWRDVGAGLELIIADDMPAPGTAAGVTFGKGTGLAFWATFDEWDHNRLGHIAFNGYLKGTGINETNDEGVWAETANGLQLVVREGHPVPAAGPGAVMNLASGFRTFGTVHHIGPQINDNGSVLFGAAFSGPTYDFGEGLWLSRNGALDLIGKAFPLSEGVGGPAPGLPGYVFTDFTDAFLNHADEIAFLAYASNGSTFQQGIWRDLEGVQSAVAHLGADVPDIPGADFGTMRLDGFTNKGQILFTATLEGPNIQPLVNDRALLFADRAGKIGVVIQRGQEIDIYGNGKHVRVVKNWTNGTLNQSLQIPIRLEFTDGTSGIFRMTIVGR